MDSYMSDPDLLSSAEHSDIPIAFVITSVARDLLVRWLRKKQIPRANTRRS